MNAAGYVKSRTDHQAFGEDIASGHGLQRRPRASGAPQANRQGYGLTEKDSTGPQPPGSAKTKTAPEDGHRRPYNGSASVGNPQSWNRYSYVESQPTNFVDPSGLDEEAPIFRMEVHTWASTFASWWWIFFGVSRVRNGGHVGEGGGGGDPKFEQCVSLAQKTWSRSEPDKPTEEEMKAFLTALGEAVEDLSKAIKRANEDFWRKTKHVAVSVFVTAGIAAYAAYKAGRAGALVGSLGGPEGAVLGAIAGGLIGGAVAIWAESDNSGVDVTREKEDFWTEYKRIRRNNPVASDWADWYEGYRQALGDCYVAYVVRSQSRMRVPR
ncbi:MAG: hypothetical protein IPK58_04450 [Acidobacteria bacterium]|nr:hypothetical protein [Acidobacteriota bacterium]